MSSSIEPALVNSVPSKPILIWDGDCRFCRFWVERYLFYTKDRLEVSTYQASVGRFPHVPLEQFQRAVHLIESDGSVRSGAHAVFRLLAYRPCWRWLPWVYAHVPVVRSVSEMAYRLVASHRNFFAGWTRFLWGRPDPDTFWLSRFLFLRVLGFAYLSAFLSLWVQLDGLIGPQGILPVEKFFSAVFQRYGSVSHFYLPSVFWLSANPAFLHLICGLGILTALLVIFGWGEAFALFLSWFFYLSFVSASQEFLSFQWDVLLLEAGLLAVFLAPLSPFPSGEKYSAPSSVALYLLRWLLFRLMFMSGMVKLLSGDPSWRNLSALTFHYQTQPLPVWVSWYAQQLPAAFQKFCCAGMFAIELIVPFFIFAPRRLRHGAAVGLITLQILIFLTGNYAFFNLLSIGLSLLLFDDKFFPAKFWARWNSTGGNSSRRPRSWSRWILIPFATVSLVSTGFMFTTRLSLRFPWPRLAVELVRLSSPLHSFNPYGLFAVMTTRRSEIVLEGTMDGKNWIPYFFKYKPGDAMRRPAFVEPHQPRLDWQMWFAALGSPQDSPWLFALIERLLQNSSPVLDLFEKNPFPDSPPRAIRARLYDYRFTTWAERHETGAWWHRDDRGIYLSPMSFDSHST